MLFAISKYTIKYKGPGETVSSMTEVVILDKKQDLTLYYL